jgi:hypothetical protein
MIANQTTEIRFYGVKGRWWWGRHPGNLPRHLTDRQIPSKVRKTSIPFLSMQFNSIQFNSNQVYSYLTSAHNIMGKRLCTVLLLYLCLMVFCILMRWEWHRKWKCWWRGRQLVAKCHSFLRTSWPLWPFFTCWELIRMSDIWTLIFDEVSIKCIESGFRSSDGAESGMTLLLADIRSGIISFKCLFSFITSRYPILPAVIF